MSKIIGFQFDNFIVDLVNRRLIHEGNNLLISSKYFDVLVLLIRRRGQLTTRQYIFDEIWHDVIVSDSSLSQCIKDIRKQLDDEASNPRFIKTIPKHGFIFTADVVEIKEGQDQPPFFRDADLAKRPYKFLDYYHEQDARLFFGREIDIQTICSKIMSHRTFIIYGRSGVGKSSIVRAGLMPTLKNNGHSVFVIRSFSDPLEALMNVLRSLTEVQEPLSQYSFNQMINQIAKNNNNKAIIFFLDQFEEFFTILPKEQREKFLHTLNDIFITEAIPIKMVFVLREDLLSEMSRFKISIPEIFHHEYRLLRLKRDQAIRAITEPAKVVGCPFEVSLAHRILNDLCELESIDPPQMQIVCDALYDIRDAKLGITNKEYDSLGGASKILANYLARVLNRFEPEELVISKEILKMLISSDKQRLILKTSQIKTHLQNKINKDEHKTDKLIEELSRARILRFRRQDGESWIELCHDFLIPEVSSWVSEEESALRRAQALLHRAMENYREHQLLIDKDSLDLILTFGVNLILNDDETELLARSMLQNKSNLPDWLVDKVPTLQTLFENTCQHPDPEVRICAIQSIGTLANNFVKKLLKNIALWDNDKHVRKSASIALLEKFGAQGEAILLKQDEQGEKAGIFRRAFSLAFVRDYNKSLVHLLHLPISIALMLLLSLIWVRIWRGREEIMRQTLGGSLGGASSGLIVGLLLGITLSLVRNTSSFEAMNLILVLLSLGVLTGIFAGFGISLGIVTMDTISYRHSNWWIIFGGALGGAAIGGFGYLIGVETLWALFGQNLSGITGAYEGFLIGGGTALGITIVNQWKKQSQRWQRVLGAAVGAMFAAIILILVKGNLFSGSIDIIAHAFANSQMRLDKVASLFGEIIFGRISHIVLGALEGFLFGGLLTMGKELFKRNY